jgi:D-alanyl-D-alanine carboxypeptidase
MTYIQIGRRFRAALIASLALITASACATLDDKAAAAALDAALGRAVEAGAPGAVMRVSSPRQGFDRRFARGLAQREGQVAMTPDTPFLSASVGKLVVAAAVHRLVADGCLRLDDPLARFGPLAELAGLPVVGGDPALATVTVAQLLGHRSGLPDYFSGTTRDGTPRLFDVIAREPARTFTRDDLFAFTRAHYTAVAAPGEVFAYADTNFDVLGVVLERVAPSCRTVPATARRFHEVVRAVVLEPLDLRSTWYHAFEPPPAHALPVADVVVDGVNLRGAPSLSADQAGGGLITTIDDLTALIRGLARGQPVALDAIATAWSENAMHAGIDVGLGAWRIRPGGVVFLLAGMPTLVGHSGATGVWAYLVPETDAVLVGAVNHADWQEKHIEFLLADVMPVLARLPPMASTATP